MTSPDSNDSHLPPGSHDRREVRRGHLVRFWDLIYSGLRTIGLHVSSFYVTVGVFLVGGILVAIFATMGFAELAEHVLEGGTQSFDVAVLEWIKQHHSPVLTQLLTEMTYLGTGIVVITVVGVTALFLWNTEHKHSARLLLASTIGAIILNNTLKYFYHRERPSVFEWGTHVASSSFPSGHAMSATVVYGTVAYLLMRLQKHTLSKVLTLSGAVILILLICFTRLYLGVHYPSDVLGGIIVGLAWAAFCMATLEASLVIGRRRAPKEVEEVPTPKEVEEAHTQEVAAV